MRKTKGEVVFGIQGWKLIIILVAALVLIGPDKVPELARTLGKAIRMFTAAKDDMEKLIKADMFAAEEPAASDAVAAESTTMASALYTDEDDQEEEEEE
jgi:TatA/E family protein of Tat protein translocase